MYWFKLEQARLGSQCCVLFSSALFSLHWHLDICLLACYISGSGFLSFKGPWGSTQWKTQDSRKTWKTCSRACRWSNGQGLVQRKRASFHPESQPAVCTHCLCCWLNYSSFRLGRLMLVGLQERCWVVTAVCSPPPPNFWMVTWWQVLLLIANKLRRFLRKVLKFSLLPFLRSLKYGNIWC